MLQTPVQTFSDPNAMLAHYAALRHRLRHLVLLPELVSALLAATDAPDAVRVEAKAVHKPAAVPRVQFIADTQSVL